jgi:uncharacterized membrane protein YgcG
MSQVLVSVSPGSGGSQGLAYVTSGGDPQLQGAGLSATVQNVATFLNSFSPAPTQAHTNVVNQYAPQNPPALTSQAVVSAVTAGVAAASAVKSLLVSAGASATVPGVGWIVGGVALLAAGAVTIVHVARARRSFDRLNSGEVLYVDQTDWSKIEDALLNGIQRFQEYARPWVPYPLFRVEGAELSCCTGTGRVSGRWIYFHPHNIDGFPGWNRLQCFNASSIGVRGCKPMAGFGAVVSSAGGIVSSDLVRVGAHAMLLTVYGKGSFDRRLVDAFTDYVTRTWSAREYVSQRIGDIIRASNDSPRPQGYQSYAYYSSHPEGATALSSTGWFSAWATSAAAAHSAALQFGVFGSEEYWRNGNPVNIALLQHIYFLYTWALYAGLPWDFIYRYLTGSVSELPVWALSAPSRPTTGRPEPPPPPPPSSSGSGSTSQTDESGVQGSGGSGSSGGSSGGRLLSLPPWLLPVLAFGLILLRKRR